jgi:hypothetical protein
VGCAEQASCMIATAEQRTSKGARRRPARPLPTTLAAAMLPRPATRCQGRDTTLSAPTRAWPGWFQPAQAGQPARPAPAEKPGRPGNQPIRGFRSLLDHLATLTRNDLRYGRPGGRAPVMAVPCVHPARTGSHSGTEIRACRDPGAGWSSTVAVTGRVAAGPVGWLGVGLPWPAGCPSCSRVAAWNCSSTWPIST